MRNHSVRVIILLGVGTVACAERPVPNAEADVAVVGAFAFASESGTRLLAIDAGTDAAAFTTAVCSSGHRDLTFVGTQARSQASSGRQVAANIDHEAGALFEIATGAAEPDETCFVTTSEMATAAQPVRPSPSASPECTNAQTAALGQHVQRELVHCWQLGTAGNETIIVAAQFATVDTSALAALALFEGELRLLHPLPGRGDSDGSVWRVDDGGVFDPDALRILFAARLPQGHALAFLWAGAEGESAQLVLADSTREARRAISAYRYWSPL
mgnify:CR=1 FL=1